MPRMDESVCPNPWSSVLGSMTGLSAVTRVAQHVIDLVSHDYFDGCLNHRRSHPSLDVEELGACSAGGGSRFLGL